MSPSKKAAPAEVESLDTQSRRSFKPKASGGLNFYNPLQTRIVSGPVKYPLSGKPPMFASGQRITSVSRKGPASRRGTSVMSVDKLVLPKSLQ